MLVSLSPVDSGWRSAAKGEMLMPNSHRDMLAARHARLEAELGAELKRPVPDAALLRQLKAQKLKLKDTLSGHH